MKLSYEDQWNLVNKWQYDDKIELEKSIRRAAMEVAVHSGPKDEPVHVYFHSPFRNRKDPFVSNTQVISITLVPGLSYDERVLMSEICIRQELGVDYPGER